MYDDILGSSKNHKKFIEVDLSKKVGAELPKKADLKKVAGLSKRSGSGSGKPILKSPTIHKAPKPYPKAKVPTIPHPTPSVKPENDCDCDDEKDDDCNCEDGSCNACEEEDELELELDLEEEYELEEEEDGCDNCAGDGNKIDPWYPPAGINKGKIKIEIIGKRTDS